MADGATKVLPENDPRGGIGIMPGWFTLGRGIVEILVGGFCTIRQFMSTYDMIVALYTINAVAPAEMLSTSRIEKYLGGQLPTYDSIAFTVALVIQIAFWWSALPATGVWSIMRRKHGQGHSLSTKDVKWRLRLRKWTMIVMFLLDAITDVMYASPGSVTIPHTDIIIPAFNLSPVIVGSLLYAVCMWFGSTFVLINGIQCIGAFISHLADNDD